jgi:hypothetical protein
MMIPRIVGKKKAIILGCDVVLLLAAEIQTIGKAQVSVLLLLPTRAYPSATGEAKKKNLVSKYSRKASIPIKCGSRLQRARHR